MPASSPPSQPFSLLLFSCLALYGLSACQSDPVLDTGGQKEPGEGQGNGKSPPSISKPGEPKPKPPPGYTSCQAGEECGPQEICRYDVCLVDRGACTSASDCTGDTYCDQPDPSEPGACVPYGIPEGKDHDPECKKLIDPGAVVPTVQCEWSAAPADDPTHKLNRVYSTPVVAELNLDHNPQRLRPSVVVVTHSLGSFDYPDGTKLQQAAVLRVFDGRTCEEQMRLGGPDDPEWSKNQPAYASQWAIADLDGDVGVDPKGHPELVGFGRHAGPGSPAHSGSTSLVLLAVGIDSSDPEEPRLERRWRGRICDPALSEEESLVTFGSNLANSGPGVWDIDDDGKPEIIVDTMVFNSEGCLLNPSTSAPPHIPCNEPNGCTTHPPQSEGSHWQNYLRHGLHSTIADVDHDGWPDLVRYDGYYHWNRSAKVWEKQASTATENLPAGHVAVADLGDYSSLPGLTSSSLPEIAVVSAETEEFNAKSTGSVRLQTLSGEIVFGPLPLLHSPKPGVNCAGSNPDRTCFGGHGGPPTIGDFDGDGYPEIAAAANQFYTVYDPDCTEDGEPLPERPGGRCDRSGITLPEGLTEWPAGVLWAQPSQDYSSSGTGSSIFDFNGDGKAEVVYRDECFLRVYEGATGQVIFSAPAPSGTGHELPVIADVVGNFSTQIVVSRAHRPNDCPTEDPLFPGSVMDESIPSDIGGFVILRDAEDRWASSRPIWNQHTYSVTHITDDARVPRSRDVKRNWETEGLNNFRQNVQGKLGALQLADITVELDELPTLCNWTQGELKISAQVCNRGTNPVTDGVEIRFAQQDPKLGEAGTRTTICDASTPQLLEVGECTQVQCTGEVDGSQDIVVIADPEDKIADCHPQNNEGASALLLCPSVR